MICKDGRNLRGDCVNFLIKASLTESAKAVEINVPGDDPLIAEILGEAEYMGENCRRR